MFQTIFDEVLLQIDFPIFFFFLPMRSCPDRFPFAIVECLSLSVNIDILAMITNCEVVYWTLSFLESIFWKTCNTNEVRWIHGKILSLDHSTVSKTSSAVLSQRPTRNITFQSDKMSVLSKCCWNCSSLLYGRNPMITRKWNLFSGTFTWYYLFSMLFYLCVKSLMVLLFKWNLFSSTFTWYCLFSM